MAAKRVGEEYVSPLPEHASVPALPPVKAVDPAVYAGPTEESNWVIKDRLLVGAYPASVYDDANARILTGILQLGITTFVCLQQEYQHEGVKEFEWRGGYKLRPYIFDAIRLVDTLAPPAFPTGRKPEGLEFVHFPIVDCATAHDASVLQLAFDLVARLDRGEVMYVHCWGGHGRTGTVVSIMLGLLYGISPLDAMRWVQFCHDLRAAPMGVASPQTETQRQQVIRVLNGVRVRQQVQRATAAAAAAAVPPPPSSSSGAGAHPATPPATARTSTQQQQQRNGSGPMGGGPDSDDEVVEGQHRAGEAGQGGLGEGLGEREWQAHRGGAMTTPRSLVPPVGYGQSVTPSAPHTRSLSSMGGLSLSSSAASAAASASLGNEPGFAGGTTGETRFAGGTTGETSSFSGGGRRAGAGAALTPPVGAKATSAAIAAREGLGRGTAALFPPQSGSSAPHGSPRNAQRGSLSRTGSNSSLASLTGVSTASFVTATSGPAPTPTTSSAAAGGGARSAHHRQQQYVPASAAAWEEALSGGRVTSAAAAPPSSSAGSSYTSGSGGGHYPALALGQPPVLGHSSSASRAAAAAAASASRGRVFRTGRVAPGSVLAAASSSRGDHAQTGTGDGAGAPQPLTPSPSASSLSGLAAAAASFSSATLSQQQQLLSPEGGGGGGAPPPQLSAAAAAAEAASAARSSAVSSLLQNSIDLLAHLSWRGQSGGGLVPAAAAAALLSQPLSPEQREQQAHPPYASPEGLGARTSLLPLPHRQPSLVAIDIAALGRSSSSAGSHDSSGGSGMDRVVVSGTVSRSSSIDVDTGCDSSEPADALSSESAGMPTSLRTSSYTDLAQLNKQQQQQRGDLDGDAEGGSAGGQPHHEPMAHASPRPPLALALAGALSSSLTKHTLASAVSGGGGGGASSGGDDRLVAASVAPLASSSASVLGLGPLVASRSPVHHPLAHVHQPAAATVRHRQPMGSAGEGPSLRAAHDSDAAMGKPSLVAARDAPASPALTQSSSSSFVPPGKRSTSTRPSSSGGHYAARNTSASSGGGPDASAAGAGAGYYSSGLTPLRSIARTGSVPPMSRRHQHHAGTALPPRATATGTAPFSSPVLHAGPLYPYSSSGSSGGAPFDGTPLAPARTARSSPGSTLPPSSSSPFSSSSSSPSLPPHHRSVSLVPSRARAGPSVSMSLPPGGDSPGSSSRRAGGGASGPAPSPTDSTGTGSTGSSKGGGTPPSQRRFIAAAVRRSPAAAAAAAASFPSSNPLAGGYMEGGDAGSAPLLPSSSPSTASSATFAAPSGTHGAFSATAQTAAIAAARAKAASAAAASSEPSSSSLSASVPAPHVHSRAGLGELLVPDTAAAAALLLAGARAPLRTPSDGTRGAGSSASAAAFHVRGEPFSSGSGALTRSPSASSLASDPYGRAGGFGIGASMPPSRDSLGGDGGQGSSDGSISESGVASNARPLMGLVPHRDDAASAAAVSALNSLKAALTSLAVSAQPHPQNAPPAVGTGMPKVSSLGSLSTASGASWTSLPRPEELTGGGQGPVHAAAASLTPSASLPSLHEASVSSSSSLSRGVGDGSLALASVGNISLMAMLPATAPTMKTALPGPGYYGGTGGHTASMGLGHHFGASSSLLLPISARSSSLASPATGTGTGTGGFSVSSGSFSSSSSSSSLVGERVLPGTPQAAAKFPRMAQAFARTGSFTNIILAGAGGGSNGSGSVKGVATSGSGSVPSSAGSSAPSTPLLQPTGGAGTGRSHHGGLQPPGPPPVVLSAHESLQELLAMAAARLQQQQQQQQQQEGRQ